MEELKKLLNSINADDYVLLKSSDEYFGCHYLGSPLNLLTGFSGSAGEAIVDKEGKITLFVDPRYHEQADCQTKGKNIDIIKLNQGEGFIKAIAKKTGNGTLHISNCVTLLFYERLQKEGLKLKPYSDFIGFGENKNINFKEEIFEVAGLKSFSEKLLELKNALERSRGKLVKDLRHYFVPSLEEIAYLTNLRSFQMANISTFKSKLLIDFEGESILFCNQKITSLPIGIKQLPLEDFEPTISKIKDKIACTKESVTLGDYNMLKNRLVLDKNLIARMASIKSKDEIKHLKSAFFRLDKALYAFKRRIKAGLSEYELKEIFEEELLRSGAKTTAFKTILAISENSSSIHYSSYDKKRILKKGDTILLDCGGYYEFGLATDITRVFLCGKNADTKQKEIYTAVLKAFLRAYHSDIKSGDDLDKLARKILKPYQKQGFLFPHALGHGIGIPVHQAPPVITSFGNKKFPLYKNMTHTIEPGLYCEFAPYKFGVRLENTVFVTGKGKRESFSRFEFEEDLIERNMLTKKEQKWLDEWQKRAREV